MTSNAAAFKDAELFQARYLPYRFASECLDSMRLQLDAPVAFLFLACNALEMFGKSYMCLVWEKRDKMSLKEMSERAQSFQHDLHRIYHYQGVGDEFLKEAGILKVDLITQRGFPAKPDLYYFRFTTERDEIQVYPSESLRYGVLTSKRNSFLNPHPKLLKLCESVQSALLKEINKYIPS